jgi:hypothetical protein
MKRYLSFCALFVVSTAFVSCLKNEPAVYSFSDEPAIVAIKGSDTLLKTFDGAFLAHGLTPNLRNGDCLVANFIVDMGKQPVENRIQLHNLTYKMAGRNSVHIASGDMQDEYTDAIAKASVYVRYVDSVLFFILEQEAGAYKYEIICNTDSIEKHGGRDIPKLYIRSAKTGTSDAKINYSAFDMTAFVRQYADPATKKVPLFLNYKTGNSQDGKDIYRKFDNYPLLWEP